jgi:hypothetical protein
MLADVKLSQESTAIELGSLVVAVLTAHLMKVSVSTGDDVGMVLVHCSLPFVATADDGDANADR